MEVVLGIVSFLYVIHLIAFSIHSLYWRQRLLWMLLDLNEKEIIKREQYLALLEEYDPSPLDFLSLRFKIFKGLPDVMDYPDLFKNERYKKFEARHSIVRRYFAKVIIILTLILVALVLLVAGREG